jgi:5-methylcytosine-specific restriction endonuclease McrA
MPQVTARASRRLPITPRSQVRRALARVFLRSRERAAAIKRDNYTCSCGRKQSRAKGREVFVEVHHVDGVDVWNEVLNLIYAKLLVSPDKLRTLCRECHRAESERQKTVTAGDASKEN